MLKIATTNLIRFAITPTLAVLLVTIGCKGKESAEGGVSLVKTGTAVSDPLLLKLPSATGAFVSIDYSGEGYTELLRSPYGGAKNAKQSLERILQKAKDNGADEVFSKIVQKLLDSGVQLGLISPEGNYTINKVIARSVFFAGSTSNGELPVDAGIFVKGASGVAMNEKLEIIRKSLSDSALTINEEDVSGSLKGFSITLANMSAKAYFAANKELLGVALNRNTLAGLFSATNTNTIEDIQASAEYKQATLPLKATENSLAFTYLSLTRLRPLIDTAIKGAESPGLNPAEIPFDALAVQSSFPKQYVHNLGLAVNPKNETQTRIFNALQGSALPPLTARLPSDTALSISVDTHLLRQLEPLIKSIEANTSEGVVAQAKNLENLTLGLRNNSAGSPLPDLFLVMDSADRKGLSSVLESSLGLAMSMTGQNTKWQTSDIDGSPTKFFTTLIGAGAFISTPANSKSLIIGTSNGITKDVLAVTSGKSQGATTTIPAPLKSQATSGNIAAFYLNFGKIADVIDSVKNTLAMFTGGNSELNEILESANIRSWGLSAGGVSYTPGVLGVNSAFLPTQQMQ